MDLANLPPDHDDDFPSVDGESTGSEGLTEVSVDLEDWFRTHADSLNLGPHTLAKQLRQDTDHIPLGTALRELQQEQTKLEDDVSAESRVFGTVNSMGRIFFLTVKDFMVQVVYGVKWCDQLSTPHPHLVAMMGDQRCLRLGQAVREPMRVKLPGNVRAQTAAFGDSEYAVTGELTQIIELLEEDGQQGQLVAEEDENEQDPTVAWRCLRVHPKLALLFLKGMPVLAAAKMVMEIRLQMPEQEAEILAPLVDFCRVACTARGTDSRIAIPWEMVDPQESDDVFEWCHAQHGQYFSDSLGPIAALPPRVRGVPEWPIESPPPPTQTDFLNLLSSAITLSQRSVDATSKRTKFSTLALETFAGLTGLIDPAHLDSEILTPFFKGLEEHRGTKVAARMYVEKHLKQNPSSDPEAPMELATIFSTDLISAIRHMDVVAEDTSVSWDERYKGLSVFSTAPVPHQLMQQAKAARLKSKHHEEAVYQKYDDIHRSSLVTTAVETWPAGPEGLRSWVRQFYRITRTMFGQEFILTPLLERLLQAMKQEMHWQAIDTMGCMALTWGIHKGIRIALCEPHNFTYLRRAINDFESGIVPTLDSVGADIARHIRAAAGGPSVPKPSSGEGGPATSGSPNSSKKRQADTPLNNGKTVRFEYGNPVTGPAFGQTWAADIKAVRDMVGARFKGNDFCTDQAKINGIFGRDFQALMPHGKPPCMKYFLLNQCYDNCPRSHTVTSPPAENVLRGIKDRVHAQCQHLLSAKNS
jgi:hypothetical protein